MALQFIKQHEIEPQTYTAKERLCLTTDGRVVKDTDKDAAFLLVGKGGRLSEKEARKHGLLDEPEKDESKAISAAPENKKIDGPDENKTLFPQEKKRSRKFKAK